MRIPKMVYLIFAALLVVGLVPLTAGAQPTPATIEPELIAKLEAEGTANFFVKMTVEADLSAAYGMDWNARGQYVWNALNEVASSTQAPVIAYCQKNGLDCTPMLVNNSVFVRGGSLDAAHGLAALPGVAYLRLERILQLPDPVTGGVGINGFETEGVTPDAVTDWGITDTKADQFWAAFGVKGEGIKVSNIDTGVQWNHPALVNQFACPNDPSNPACWADPSNICGGSACDNAGHGTHTMGTMVAKDDPSFPYIAGMAPNASWIACKGCESSSCSDYALTTCATWLLAPGGNPANRPNIVNNSWGGGGGDPWYQSYVISWVADGIFPAFSAGNSTGCGSMGSPGDYQESFASTGHGSSRGHVFAQGPSAFGHDPYTKPNVTAPAVSICSSVPTNGWSCGYSGTSMASPHSAGAAALLYSCNPSLIGQVYPTFEALQNSADPPDPTNPPCGAPPDGEGTYEDGYGYLNTLQMGVLYCGGVALGTLEGHVYDDGGQPIAGASVLAQPAAEGAGVNAVTDPSGFYSMQLLVGTYNVTASKQNYTSQTVNGIVITENQIVVQDFTIVFLGGWTQIPLPAGCPDLTRYDAEYYAPLNRIYIMGGRGGVSGGDTYGDIYWVDPVSGVCTDTGANVPNPVSNYTINLVNNGTADLLCIFGGRAASGTSTLNVQCYDPNANTAAIVTNLPVAYTGYTPGAEVVLGNMVYVFGGFNNLTPPYELARTDRYDPVTNTFAQIGNLSQARSYIDAAVVDGKIYAFGGTVFDGTNLNAQTRTEVMADPAGAGTWDNAAVAELVTATAEGRAFGFDTGAGYTLDGKIVIVAGGQWPAETNAVFTYDTATNTYDESFPDLNAARRDQAGVFVPGSPGRMWVFGGRQGVDTPPYMTPEYFDVPQAVQNFLHLNKMKINGALAARPGYVKVITLIRVWDQGMMPVAGADAFGEWTYPDGSMHPAQAIALTDSMGRTKFRVKEPQCGLYQFDLTDLTKTGFLYDPGANQVPTHVEITVNCP